MSGLAIRCPTLFKMWEEMPSTPVVNEEFSSLICDIISSSQTGDQKTDWELGDIFKLQKMVVQKRYNLLNVLLYSQNTCWIRYNERVVS